MINFSLFVLLKKQTNKQTNKTVTQKSSGNGSQPCLPLPFLVPCSKRRTFLAHNQVPGDWLYCPLGKRTQGWWETLGPSLPPVEDLSVLSWFSIAATITFSPFWFSVWSSLVPHLATDLFTSPVAQQCQTWSNGSWVLVSHKIAVLIWKWYSNLTIFQLLVPRPWNLSYCFMTPCWSDYIAL